MRIKSWFTGFLLLIISASRAQQSADVVKATLNGLEFVFDAQSGSIVGLQHAGTGTMIRTSPDSAGMIDLAFPVREFEPLRLASRYSKNARITVVPGTVTIHWDEL